MNDAIQRKLYRQLGHLGLEPQFVPSFFRVLRGVLDLSPQVSLWQVNRRLAYLGWPGFELDYHTLELALACMSAPGGEVPSCRRRKYPGQAYSA